MSYVNAIAKIVHMEVSLHYGSANKIIGDAFLLVWKFSKESGKPSSTQPPNYQPNKQAS